MDSDTVRITGEVTLKRKRYWVKWYAYIMNDMLIYGQNKNTSPQTRGNANEVVINLSGCILKKGKWDNGAPFL